MFQFKINGVLVIFSKFFSVGDREAVVAAVQAAGPRRVVFVDTAATDELVNTVETLVAHGFEVVVRDHHDEPNPGNPRAAAVAAAAARVRELVGGNAVISDRGKNPACSSLIEIGEFAAADGGAVIVADNDADGLTAAMKGCGIFYPALDGDAAILDGQRAGQTAETLSPLAMLLVKGLATLPPFDANRPQFSEDAKGKLFAEFVAAVSGDAQALENLGRKVEEYEAGVRQAERLAETVTDLAPGVAFVDVASSPRFDLGTLAAKMDSRSGCKVTVQRKDSGPIAGKHGGIQVSLAVVKAFQGEINLQELLPSGFVSSPESGIISNTSFLLHLSETIWNDVVRPALLAKVAGN